MKLGARLFRLGLAASARVVRSPLGGVGAAVLGLVGSGLARARAINRDGRDDPRRLGERWQRAFPSRKQVPIVAVDATTAYAEIHVSCPLRGTGDVDACHRMMAYDRGFAARAGARFVVLESQATPGVEVCRVALRREELPADDLVPAHKLNRR